MNENEDGFLTCVKFETVILRLLRRDLFMTTYLQPPGLEEVHDLFCVEETSVGSLGDVAHHACLRRCLAVQMVAGRRLCRRLRDDIPLDGFAVPHPRAQIVVDVFV